jgi:hypothetical protein
MLQYPPTRIGLMPADITIFDTKQVARQPTHLSRQNPAGLRLASGPDRAVAASIVSVDAVPSSSFHATFGSSEDDARHGIPIDNPSLDPAAAVFLPRTRFGSTTTASIDSDHTRSTAPTPSSFDQPAPRPPTRPVVHHPSALPHHTRATTREQIRLQLPSPDGYPILPPESIALPAETRTHDFHRPLTFPRRRSSRQHLLEYQRVIRKGQDQAVSSTPSSLSSVQDPPIHRTTGLRPASPAHSSSSHSTPNLLQSKQSPPLDTHSHARSSSLTWQQTSLYGSGEGIRGMPSTLGSRGVRGSPFDSSELASNSPLDELSQQLSRMMSSSSRPRSVGRSFERPLQASRITLLSGDPFRPDSSPERTLPGEEQGYRTYVSPVKDNRRDSVIADLVAATAVALAIPYEPTDHFFTGSV